MTLDTLRSMRLPAWLGGRIGRLRYIAYTFPAVLLYIGLGMLTHQLGWMEGDGGWIWYQANLAVAGALAAAVALRRLGDANLPRPIALLFFMPVVGLPTQLCMLVFALLAIVPGTPGPNLHGPVPAPNHGLVALLACGWLVLPFWLVWAFAANLAKGRW